MPPCLRSSRTRGRQRVPSAPCPASDPPDQPAANALGSILQPDSRDAETPRRHATCQVLTGGNRALGRSGGVRGSPGLRALGHRAGVSEADAWGAAWYGGAPPPGPALQTLRGAHTGHPTPMLQPSPCLPCFPAGRALCRLWVPSPEQAPLGSRTGSHLSRQEWGKAARPLHMLATDSSAGSTESEQSKSSSGTELGTEPGPVPLQTISRPCPATAPGGQSRARGAGGGGGREQPAHGRRLHSSQASRAPRALVAPPGRQLLIPGQGQPVPWGWEPTWSLVLPESCSDASSGGFQGPRVPGSDFPGNALQCI